MKIFIKKYASMMLVPGMLLVNSCDDFGDVNVNPNAIQSPTPEYVFSKAIYDGTAVGSNHASLLLGNMQYTTSYNDVAGFGSKYVAAQQLRSSNVFSDAYPNQINEIEEVIKALRDDETKVNQLSIARIWRVFCYSRLTDVYGDIPYTEGAQGYTQGIYQPVYTPQSEIYADMLKELQESTGALTAGGATFGAGDVIYGGNIEKWRKFGYSLMLRLGMRLTNVPGNQAQTWVQRAITGGVIMDDADIAAVRNYNATGQGITRNPIANSLYNSDYIARNGKTNTEGGKYQETFIDSLKANNDPRLPILSIVWTGPDNARVASNDPAIQKGMPDDVPGTPPPNFGDLSEPNPATVLLLSGAQLIFTTQEINFLLAEAALRGWYNANTPAELYEAGIRAGMRQWQITAGAAGAIDQDDIDDYVADHPLVTTVDTEAQLEQIYTQFWMGAFPDATEVFNTYRRLGYPALTPNNYGGNATGGKLIRRFMYPTSEQTLNPTSYRDAITRQGADNLNTHVWWDQ
jgi:hypothetical protein